MFLLGSNGNTYYTQILFRNAEHFGEYGIRFLTDHVYRFKPGYETEIALVTLVDDLWQKKQDRVSTSILALLDLSGTFGSIYHGIFSGEL